MFLSETTDTTKRNLSYTNFRQRSFDKMNVYERLIYNKYSSRPD